MRSINGRLLARSLSPLLNGRTTGPAYGRLAEAIRLLILDGRLALETRLPSERDLAAALSMSRTTVTAAYDSLRASGYVTSRQGSGTWTSLPNDRPRGMVTAFAPTTSSTHIDLAPACPAAPSPELRAAYEHALTVLPHYLAGHGYHLLGLPSLREAVARRYTARGLPTTADQIMITAGAQQAFTIILSAFVQPGDRVLIEHPTYPNALDVLRRVDARPVPVTLKDDGWDLDAITEAARQSTPRLAYLIPDFHNPTGMVATNAERRRIAAALTRSNTVIVADETNVELGFTDPPPPMAGYAPGVITTGGANKPFWGGLRIGWVRAGASVIRRLATVRASLDISSPVVEQEAAAYLIDRADDILPRRRADLRRRRDEVMELLRDRLPDWLIRVPDGGLVLWCDMGVHVASRLAAVADGYGLRLAAGPRFGVDGAFERWLRVPFTLPPEVMRQAIDLLAEAFAAVHDGAPRAREENLEDLFA